MKRTESVTPGLGGNKAFQSFIAQLPQSFQTGGTVLNDKRNTIKLYPSSEGCAAFVVKRFRHLLLIQRIIYTFFRATKACRAYRNGVELLRREVRTPQPMAYIDFRDKGLIADSYYICEECDWPPIADLLRKAEHFDRHLAHDFARFALSLHRKGILHGDLNETNTLYHLTAAGTYEFSVIDINRMEFTPPGHASWAKRKDNLTRFTNRMDVFEYVAREYSAAAGLGEKAVKELLESKHRHDRNRRRRKGCLRFLKRIFNVKL